MKENESVNKSMRQRMRVRVREDVKNAMCERENKGTYDVKGKNLKFLPFK